MLIWHYNPNVRCIFGLIIRKAVKLKMKDIQELLSRFEQLTKEEQKQVLEILELKQFLIEFDQG